MGIRQVEVEEYVCDGCGKAYHSPLGDPPVGITLRWFEVSAGGESGTLWIDSERCLRKAFARRYEIEQERDHRG